MKCPLKHLSRKLLRCTIDTAQSNRSGLGQTNQCGRCRQPASESRGPERDMLDPSTRRRSLIYVWQRGQVPEAELEEQSGSDRRSRVCQSFRANTNTLCPGGTPKARSWEKDVESRVRCQAAQSVLLPLRPRVLAALSSSLHARCWCSTMIACPHPPFSHTPALCSLCSRRGLLWCPPCCCAFHFATEPLALALVLLRALVCFSRLLGAPMCCPSSSGAPVLSFPLCSPHCLLATAAFIAAKPSLLPSGALVLFLLICLVLSHVVWPVYLLVRPLFAS